MGDITVTMKRANTGFTLIELLMTMVIAALLLTLGVPAFNDTVRNNRLTTQANNLVTSFNMARSEAVKRRSNITVCSSSDQASCTGGAWQGGWIVMDAGTNEVLRIFNPMNGSTAVAGTANSIQYTAEGFLNAGNPVTLTLCAESGEPGRQINITATGRPNNVTPYPTC